MNDFTYQTDQFGIIHQVPPIITAKYDSNYVADRYVKYGIKTRGMAMLRLGFILSNTPKIIESSILDVGYGDGSFLAAVQDAGIACGGYDISDYPLPPGVRKIESMTKNRWGMVTFFDSLEHFESIDILGKLATHWITVTAPECHFPQGTPGFMEWKHRRPGEHLHHFNRETLTRYMTSINFELIACANIEDAIRGEDEGSHYKKSNTFTAIYKRM